MPEIMKMGWIRDLPDFRDYTVEKPDLEEKFIVNGQKDSIQEMMKIMKLTSVKKPPSLPSSKDLRPWCSPIEDQDGIGSCTANAGVGLVEYFEKRAFGTYTDASRLFLYKVTRDLLNWVGDTGAYLRTTMAALALFGAPPEKYWPYIVAKFDIEPTAFLYAFAQNYQAIQYYRLDPLGVTPANLLNTIKTYIYAYLPSMFGFTVYSSYTQANATGEIPFPVRTERAVGGHAVVAVGYDDTRKIKNANAGAVETTGALLIRNSWGTAWGGMGGYLWLPYEYVLRGLAVDWWSIIKNEWVNTHMFGIT
jgi:C1A family cysteine protease